MSAFRLSSLFPSQRRIVEIPIPVSGSWTPDAEYVGLPARIHCIAPGGSGAFSTTTTHRVSGGGAGEHVFGDGVLESIAYTSVVGAGGAPVVATGNGNNGGSVTSFSGGDFSLSANPGSGGVQSAASTAAGGAGGTGGTGDVTYDGGDGGDCANANSQATGGGAIGWNRDGFDAANTAGGSSEMSGGAGLGGTSRSFAHSNPTTLDSGGPGIAGFQQMRYFGEGGGTMLDTGLAARGSRPSVGAGSGGVRGAASSSSAPASMGGGSGGCLATSGGSGPAGDGYILVEIEVPF